MTIAKLRNILDKSINENMDFHMVIVEDDDHIRFIRLDKSENEKPTGTEDIIEEVAFTWNENVTLEHHNYQEGKTWTGETTFHDIKTTPTQ